MIVRERDGRSNLDGLLGRKTLLRASSGESIVQSGNGSHAVQ